MRWIPLAIRTVVKGNAKVAEISARVGRVDQDDLAAAPRNFVGELPCELAPGGVQVAAIESSLGPDVLARRFNRSGGRSTQRGVP